VIQSRRSLFAEDRNLLLQYAASVLRGRPLEEEEEEEIIRLPWRGQCATTPVGLLQRDFKVWDAKSQACFYFAPPPRNPGCFYRKHRPPHRPRQAPRPKTPFGPKIDFGTTPRRSWCASKEVILAHIFPVTSPTPRWVTARPRRPPRGDPGHSRSKISAPWGVQSRSRLEPEAGGGEAAGARPGWCLHSAQGTRPRAR
jgi:hypothetical protein